MEYSNSIKDSVNKKGEKQIIIENDSMSESESESELSQVNWELIDPVDVMPKFPKNLDEQLRSKKCQERKEALKGINEIIHQFPKLADNPDYVDLIEKFIKVILIKGII
jgi:hypothetical protein